MLRVAIGTIALVGIGTGAALADASPRVLAIVHATLVHPERPAGYAVAADATIVMKRGRIVTVGPTSAVKVPAGAQVIDGAGRWVIPS